MTIELILSGSGLRRWIAVVGLLATAPQIARAGGLGVPAVDVSRNHCDLKVAANGMKALPDGRVAVTVKNSGGAACPAFRTSLAIGNASPESLATGSLAAGFSAQLVSSGRLTGCAAVPVQVSVDSQDQAPEAVESNNTMSATVQPPCPDLVPELYSTDEDGGFRYQVHVRVTNRGALPTPRSFLVLVGGFSLIPAQNQETEEIRVLAPGESVSFSHGPKRLKTSKYQASVRADRGDWIEESNEDNNYDHRTFGPH